jgi:hypothetical protein
MVSPGDIHDYRLTAAEPGRMVEDAARPPGARPTAASLYGPAVTAKEARMNQERPLRLLLEGRPGIGKTTVARRLVALLRDTGIPPDGFVTDELRRGGQREGFAVHAVTGHAVSWPTWSCPAPHASAATAWTFRRSSGSRSRR